MPSNQRTPVFKRLSPAVKFPISITNRFSALNGLTQGHNGPPFDSNHDPGPQHAPSPRAPAPTRLSAKAMTTCSLPPSSICVESFLSQINQITTSSRSLIKLSGTLSGRPAVFLVDSGATGNFVNDAFVNKHRVSSMSLPSQDIVTLADGSQQTAAAFVPSASVAIGTYTDRLDLVSLPLAGYDAILGMPWLHHYNPHVDWQRKSIKFAGSDHLPHVLMSADSLDTGRQHSTVKPPPAVATAQSNGSPDAHKVFLHDPDVVSSSLGPCQHCINTSDHSDHVPSSPRIAGTHAPKDRRYCNFAISHSRPMDIKSSDMQAGPSSLSSSGPCGSFLCSSAPDSIDNLCRFCGVPQSQSAELSLGGQHSTNSMERNNTCMQSGHTRISSSSTPTTSLNSSAYDSSNEICSFCVVAQASQLSRAKKRHYQPIVTDTH